MTTQPDSPKPVALMPVAILAEVIAVLEPFAHEAEQWDKSADDCIIAGDFDLQLGNLRAAAALLAKLPQAQEAERTPGLDWELSEKTKQAIRDIDYETSRWKTQNTLIGGEAALSDAVERATWAVADVLAKRHGNEAKDWMSDARREEARAALSAARQGIDAETVRLCLHTVESSPAWDLTDERDKAAWQKCRDFLAALLPEAKP